MHPIARKIRKIIGHIPGAWVRVWGDGEIWAGASNCDWGWKRAPSSKDGMILVRDALTQAGYTVECKGTPDTSGQFIVDVIKLPNEKE